MSTAPNTLSWSMKPLTPPLNRTHVAIGVAASLLLHLLLGSWAWLHQMAEPRLAEKITIAVHLLPPAPSIPVAPPPSTEPLKPNKDATARSTRRAVVTTAPVQAKQQQVMPEPASPPSPAPQQEKHLDMNAIYGSVKSAVKEIDRENAETPVGQLAAKPLYQPESGNKMGKMIDGTTRGDCKEQVSGYGLFAPLAAVATLLDKKDNGCKWR
ncbi:MAG: hypothetical protein JO002_01645 [Burkholderiaceae bacterium]|nr:hypothetical protein [Burkholderiaceae bacterium]